MENRRGDGRRGVVQRAPGLVALAVVLLGSASALGDWPMFRHDTRRTATASSNPAGIKTPTPFWRYYLGGSINRTQIIYDDVAKQILYLSGGKLIAKLADDTVKWETPLIGATTIAGTIADLDGDGVRDVALVSSNFVYIVATQNNMGVTPGTIEWFTDENEFGTVGGARMADFDGDGKLDLFVDECGCCGVSKATSGAVYSFANGFGSKDPLWRPTPHNRCGVSAETVGDFDGDGTVDLAFPDLTTVKFVRRPTQQGSKVGELLGESAAYNNMASILYTAWCDAKDIDGKKGDELVCYQDTYQGSSGSGGRRVFVYTYDATKTPKVQKLWGFDLPDLAADRLYFGPNSLVDLDGDGKYEIVVAAESMGTTRTIIFDAATGTELGSAMGERLGGIADVTGDGKPELMVQGALNSNVAYQFDRTKSPTLTKLWQLVEDVTFPQAEDHARASLQTSSSTPLAFDLDGDNVAELLLVRRGSTTTGAALVAYKADKAAPPTVFASYELPIGLTFLSTDRYANVTQAGNQVVLTRSDGYLVVLDQKLAPTNMIVDPEFPLPGMRIGGFVSTAIAPSFDGARDTLVVRDSRGSLISLDPASANLVIPPKVTWQVATANSPSGVPNLDGNKPGLVCYRTPKDKDYRLTALKADGTQIWEQQLTAPPIHDPLPGDVNNDNVPDIFTQTNDIGSVLHLNVRNGKTGAAIWGKDFVEPLQWGSQPYSVADFNGDGAADLIGVLNTLRVWNGKDGTVLASNTDSMGKDIFLAYGMPVVADVDGDGVEEITFQGGYYQARTFKKDLKTTLWTGTDINIFPYGARAVCPGGVSVWVGATLDANGMIRFTRMNGTDAGKSTVTWYVDGKDYPSLAAVKTAGKIPGIIGNVTIKPNLLGPNTPPTALFGANDGWLYAVDVCSGTGALNWAHNFKAPVGEPILADTNGDGKDEILVAAGDGYLYDLRDKIIDAPAWVWDIDVPKGIVNMDVDEIETVDTLYAKWASVAGATGYEYAVISGNTIVLGFQAPNPPTSTQVTIPNLMLTPGKKYRVAVRAQNANGSSVEALSSGVVVKSPFKPDMAMPADMASGSPDMASGGDLARPAVDMAGPSLAMGGCGCTVGARPSPTENAGLLAFAVIALGVALRLRRKQR